MLKVPYFCNFVYPFGWNFTQMGGKILRNGLSPEFSSSGDTLFRDTGTTIAPQSYFSDYKFHTLWAWRPDTQKTRGRGYEVHYLLLGRASRTPTSRNFTSGNFLKMTIWKISVLRAPSPDFSTTDYTFHFYPLSLPSTYYQLLEPEIVLIWICPIAQHC